MEHILIDYLANATWQIPLLAGAAWLFIRLAKFGPQTQHCIWLAVLGLAVALPLRGVRADLPDGTQTSCTDCSMDASAITGREALPRAAIVTQFVVADPRLSKEFFTLPRPTLRLSPAATDWLVGLYFSILLFRVYKILTAWNGARRLVMEACPTVLPPQWNEIFEESGRRLGAKLPQLLESAAVRSPVIVGMLKPALLLPDDFDHHSQNEVQAALYHELAHVRRNDYLGNLLCQLAALPVAWHPLTYGVQQRIRRTREMVCDAIAARAMQSEIGYAKCLLAMAGRTLGQHALADGSQAIGLFGDNVLEERIMRLMQEKTTMTMQAKLARVATGATAMVLAIGMAASFHVTPTLAQSTDNTVTAPAPPVAPAAPEPSISPAAPEAPVAPPAPDASVSPAVPPAPVAPVALADQNPQVTPPAPVAPVAPPAPDASVTPVAPIPPVAPEPAEAKPSHPKVKAVHPHQKTPKHESFVIDSNHDHAMTVEQQAQFNQDMATMNAQIAEATKRFNSPEFKQQMAEIAKQQADMKHLDFAQMQRQIDAATAKINSPEFKQQMAEIAKQQADVKRLDFAQMQQQIDAATAKINSPEFKQQMAEIAKQQADVKHLDFAQMQRQIDAATAKINSPEFKQQMENIQKQIQSGAMQRSMEEATRQLKAAEDQMRQAQTK
jgi:beta-lactamase regulating signal transducer with metallopeptidase domain